MCVPRSFLWLVILSVPPGRSLFLRPEAEDNVSSFRGKQSVDESNPLPSTIHRPARSLDGKTQDISIAPVKFQMRELLTYGILAIGISAIMAGLAIHLGQFFCGLCRTSSPNNYHQSEPAEPVWAGDDSIQVLIFAKGQEAELELRADCFDSYEKLRELVVDALPGMFTDSDEIVLDYLNERSSWVRIKTRTPLSTVKAAQSIRMSCRKTKKNKKLSREGSGDLSIPSAWPLSRTSDRS